MKLTTEQKEALFEVLPSEADALIVSGSVRKVIDALDDMYLCLLDDQDEPTDEARKCERLRDDIFWDN